MEYNHYTTQIQKTSVMSDKQLLKTLVTDPRKAFEYILNKNYEKYLYLILFLIGGFSAIDSVLNKHIEIEGIKWLIVLLAFIFGGLFGWIGAFITAALVSWTGRWLGGEAETMQLFKVNAYAQLPIILSVILVIPKLAIFGTAIFSDELNITSGGMIGLIIYYICFLLELSLSIWCMVLMVIAISVTQKFSIGRAILNILIPSFILGFLVLLFYILVL